MTPLCQFPITGPSVRKGICTLVQTARLNSVRLAPEMLARITDHNPRAP